jgi:hypothetical protein
MTKLEAAKIIASQKYGCHGPIFVPCDKCPVWEYDDGPYFCGSEIKQGDSVRAWLRDHPSLWDRIKKSIRGKFDRSNRKTK